MKHKLATMLGLCAATGLLATGCSGSSGHHDAAASGANKSATGLKADPSLPDAAGNNPALIKQVKQTSCGQIPGGWSASGVAQNSGATAVDYNVLVYFTTPSATVISSASTKVSVQPGATAKWDVSNKFNTEPGMRCVVVKVT